MQRPQDLNRVLRSHYLTPSIDEILPDLSRAKLFSTVGAKNEFWHVELDDDSSQLTTFNSPFGRFRWLRLPFGLCTAPEEFQRRLNHALEGKKGVLPIHDDLLVFGEGSTEDEALDKGLGAVLLHEGQPIAYGSRTLTDPETRYAQIEELLTVVYGLKKNSTPTRTEDK